MKSFKETVHESRLYRQPKKVTQVCVYRNGESVAICPTCNKSIDKDYQAYCSCCGQRLKWTVYEYATVRYV